jgi:hypothetical protein
VNSIEEKQRVAENFENAEVRAISFEEARPLILQYEYLGTTGSAKIFYGLFFGPYLGCVVGFGSTAGTRVAASVCGEDYADKVIELVRGCRTPWAHEHSATYLISRAAKDLAERGKNIIIAYSDPAGGERGVIYKAANFLPFGETGKSEKFVTPDGKVHDGRAVSGMTRDRRGGDLRYKRTRKQQKAILEAQGCKFEKGTKKRKWVLISGDRRMKRTLQKAFEMKHPKLKRQQALLNEINDENKTPADGRRMASAVLRAHRKGVRNA